MACNKRETAEVASIIEKLAKREISKLKLRLNELWCSDTPRSSPEVADVKQCLELMEEGSAKIAAALFDIDSP